jgi:hypothetical protein
LGRVVIAEFAFFFGGEEVAVGDGAGGWVVGGECFVGLRGILGFVSLGEEDEFDGGVVLALKAGVEARGAFHVGEGGGGMLLFEAEEAEDAPAGGDHFVDEGVFGGEAGVEFALIGLEQFEEFVLALAGEKEGGGEDAVAEGVEFGNGFAFRGDGTLGLGAIGARGFNLCVRTWLFHAGRMARGEGETTVRESEVVEKGGNRGGGDL